MVAKSTIRRGIQNHSVDRRQEKSEQTQQPTSLIAATGKRLEGTFSLDLIEVKT